MASSFASLTPAQRTALLEGPALKSPDGVTHNFINPSNQNVLGYSVLLTCIALSAIVVVIRIYAKAFCSKRVDIEDYLALAALGVYSGYAFIIYRIIQFPGAYVHQWNVKLKDLSGILYNINASSTIYGIIIMLLKVGIMLEWVRIFVPRGFRNVFFWTCHMIIWINILFYVACTIVEIFGCTPREKIWNKLLPGGTCINNHAVILASSVLNFVSDLVILSVPQKIIWGLKMSTRKRVGISLIFAIGVFGCICGALRMVYSIHFLRSDDITYTIAPVGLWCIGEITSGFFILCIPSIPMVLRSSVLGQKFITLMRSWTGSSGTKEKTNLRRGPPSWYGQMSTRKKLQDPNICDVDTHGLVTEYTNKTLDRSVSIRESVSRDQADKAHTIDYVLVQNEKV